MIILRVDCVVCARPFDASRRTAKYCGETCKKRAQRAGTSTVAELPSRPGKSGGSLVDVVRRELGDADRLDTFWGQQALELAGRIVSPVTSAGAVPGLSKQLAVVRAEAMAGVVIKTDAVDEFSERLRQKRAAAGA